MSWSTKARCTLEVSSLTNTYKLDASNNFTLMKLTCYSRGQVPRRQCERSKGCIELLLMLSPNGRSPDPAATPLNNSPFVSIFNLHVFSQIAQQVRAEAATASQIIYTCTPRVNAPPSSPLQGNTAHKTMARLPLSLRVHAGRGRPPLPSLPSTKSVNNETTGLFFTPLCGDHALITRLANAGAAGT